MTLTLPVWVEEVLAKEVAVLSPELRTRWSEVQVPPARLRDVIVLGRSGMNVLGYDEAEEEFGTGKLDASGKLIHWGTWGDRLAWALPHI
jgi:hypothetical protein